MRKIVLLLLTAIGFVPAFACTTFFINKNGQMVFGRNYDWVTGSGMVCTNQRGLAKTSFKTKDGETIRWTSLYGSITFNQYGKEFPTGGMNEKGLVVELMWLDGTKYPAADNRPAVGVLQWIQYQLDNCSTVDELIATDTKLRIASGTTPLHYLVADAKGNAATIEFLDGKMVIHKDDALPFPVLTNNSYEESLPLVKPALKNNHTIADNSLQRFVKACSMVQSYQAGAINVPILDYSFDILDKVAQGGQTKWSIVYDISNKKIHFKTLEFPAVKNITFSSFDFSCSTAAKAWIMNQPGQADVNNLFVLFSEDLNRRIVEKSFKESAVEIRVSKEGIRETWQYGLNIFCQNPSQ